MKNTGFVVKCILFALSLVLPSFPLQALPWWSFQQCISSSGGGYGSVCTLDAPPSNPYWQGEPYVIGRSNITVQGTAVYGRSQTTLKRWAYSPLPVIGATGGDYYDGGTKRKVRLFVSSHGFKQGDSVEVRSLGGIPDTDVKISTITFVNANQFDLDASEWKGVYTGGGTVRRHMRSFFKLAPWVANVTIRDFLLDGNRVGDGIGPATEDWLKQHFMEIDAGDTGVLNTYVSLDLLNSPGYGINANSGTNVYQTNASYVGLSSVRSSGDSSNVTVQSSNFTGMAGERFH